MEPTWAGAHAVVTGSAGFVGRHLTARLLAEGACVTGLDREPPPPGAGGVHEQLELTAAGDRDRAAAALAAADVVFHLAGRDDRAAGGPARRRDNGLATAMVLGATPAGTPIVVTSSASVYGGARVRGDLVVPSHECDPVNPRGDRARSKVFVERLCARRRARGGLVTVVRPFTLAGPGQGPGAALSRWLRAAACGVPLQVPGSLDRRRDLVDVRQVAAALVGLARRVDLDVVNVGTGVPVTARAVVDAVGRATGRPPAVDVVPAPRDAPHATRAHTGRLAEAIGWVPAADLDEVVAAQWAADADLHSGGRSANMAWHSSASSASVRS
jgi:nucleoside-diphosphate-sugar epimerase